MIFVQYLEKLKLSQSDDYSGRTLTNPTIPEKYKQEIKKEV